MSIVWEISKSNSEWTANTRRRNGSGSRGAQCDIQFVWADSRRLTESLSARRAISYRSNMLVHRKLSRSLVSAHRTGASVCLSTALYFVLWKVTALPIVCNWRVQSIALWRFSFGERPVRSLPPLLFEVVNAWSTPAARRHLHATWR